MFKLFFIGALVYLLYRVSMTSSLQAPKQKTKSNIKTSQKPKERKVDDEDYIDYEELD